VLLKRRMLIQSGWPRKALLVTVVHDKHDKGHAVLTVGAHAPDRSDVSGFRFQA
jgi:predicted transglutaminase-like cysteine proteinase